MIPFFKLPERDVTTKLGIFIYKIPPVERDKGNKTFPLPKDNIVDEIHKNNAKTYCNSFTNKMSCESAGWSLNSSIDKDMACRWGVETSTKQAASLIGGVGEGTKNIPVIGGFIDIFTKPVAQTVESAGKIETCHYMQIPGNMTVEQFYQPTPVVQPQQVVPVPVPVPLQSPPPTQPAPAIQQPVSAVPSVPQSQPPAVTTGSAKKGRI